MQAKTRLSTLPAFASIPALRSGTPPAVLPSLPQDTGDDRIRHPVENLLFSPACRLRSLSCLPGNFRKNRSKSSRFLRRSLRFESLIILGKKNLDSKKTLKSRLYYLLGRQDSASSRKPPVFSFLPAALAKLPSLATFVKTAPSLRVFYAARSASNP